MIDTINSLSSLITKHLIRESSLGWKDVSMDLATVAVGTAAWYAFYLLVKRAPLVCLKKNLDLLTPE
jgi:hypothetical protein